MENEIVVSNGPYRLIEMAITKGTDIAQLEKLLELQERYEANMARKAYVEAMTAFKQNPPDIVKDSQVSYSARGGITAYNHASLANVTKTINSALSIHGLSAAWKTEQTDRSITVTCCITHIMGHSECTSLTAFPDESGGKNAIQAIGSTVTYLQRYTILSLTGLSTHDQDDDGKGSEPVEYINEKQLSEITDLILASESNEQGFLDYMKVESLDKIPSTQFMKARAILVKKLEQKKVAK